jgi:hypothetical protein
MTTSEKYGDSEVIEKNLFRQKNPTLFALFECSQGTNAGGEVQTICNLLEWEMFTRYKCWRRGTDHL